MNRQQNSSTSSLQGLLLDGINDRDGVNDLNIAGRPGPKDGSEMDCASFGDVADLDSCFSDSDVFDPPAPWRPGRFLQFADIDLTAEDEPSVRPVSLPTERLGPGGHSMSVGRCTTTGAGGDRFESLSLDDCLTTSRSGAFVVQMDTDRMLCLRHWKPSVSKRTLVVMTSCMTVALTALTLLSFVL